MRVVGLVILKKGGELRCRQYALLEGEFFVELRRLNEYLL